MGRFERSARRFRDWIREDPRLAYIKLFTSVLGFLYLVGWSGIALFVLDRGLGFTFFVTSCVA